MFDDVHLDENHHLYRKQTSGNSTNDFTKVKSYENGVVSLSFNQQNGIALINMNSPPVNALGEKLLSGLFQVFQGC